MQRWVEGEWRKDAAVSRRSTILIVDDEPLGRDTLEALLIAHGYNLAFASSGPEALAKAAELTPDLVLLDVMMPGMDGFEVCRRLRADPLLNEVPVMMVTALDDRDSRLQGIEAGADDFVTKPFDPAELRARVRTVTRLNRYRRLLAERTKFQWVVDKAADGYLIVDDSGRVLYANSQARLYLGLPVTDTGPAVGGEREPVSETFPELIKKQYRRAPQEAWAFGPEQPTGAAQPPRYLVRPESASSPAFWLQVDVLDLPSGSDGGWIVRLRDLTAQVALQRDMWTFHEVLFHKLRTPLTGMLVSMELLTKHAAGLSRAEIAEFSKTAFRSAQRLHGQIEDVLQYTSAPRMAQPGAGFPTSQLLPLVAQISVELELASVSMPGYEGGGDARLSLSQRAVELVLREVLENAKKFHPKQTPRVEVLVSSLGSGEVCIRIRDDGRTLSPDQLARMWQPYFQAEKSFTGEVPGMGLGLSVAATLVWGVGGACRAYNREDGPGVVVELVLPLAQGEGDAST
jgi:two-component system cell cycle response regulator